MQDIDKENANGEPLKSVDTGKVNEPSISSWALGEPRPKTPHERKSMSTLALIFGAVFVSAGFVGILSLWPQISFRQKPALRSEAAINQLAQKPPVFPGKTTYFENAPKPKEVLSGDQPKFTSAPSVKSGNTVYFGDAKDFTTSPSRPSAVPDERRKESPPRRPLSNAVPSGDDSPPIMELISYLEALKTGKAAFSWNISGEEAAKQLGYSRLFASAYDELALQIQSRLKTSSVHISDVQNAFDHILQEERLIDKLMRERDARHAASIAYLRALQNGDVTFPGPRLQAPSPQVLLLQLISSDPRAKFPIDEIAFAALYSRTREYAATQVRQQGEVHISEIIASLRQNIIASTTAGPSLEQTCEDAKTLGQLAALPQVCSNLRMSEALSAALSKTATNRITAECRERSETSATTTLKGLDQQALEKDCALLERGVRAGQVLVYSLQGNQR